MARFGWLWVVTLVVFTDPLGYAQEQDHSESLETVEQIRSCLDAAGGHATYFPPNGSISNICWLENQSENQMLDIEPFGGIYVRCLQHPS